MALGRKKARHNLHLVWPASRLGGPLAAWLAICVLMLSLSGCLLGPFFGLFAKKSPTVTVAAEYKLPAGNLLILVDSPTERTGLSGVSPLLSSELAREIREQGLAPTVIPTGELANLQISTEKFDQLDIAQIGRRLSARQVLYVEVIEFTLGTLVDSSVGRGVVRTRVKVFDVELNQTVWPRAKPLGEEVIVQTPFREPPGKDYRQEFTEDLCKRTAIAIIKLFREHEEPRQISQSQ